MKKCFHQIIYIIRFLIWSTVGTAPKGKVSKNELESFRNYSVGFGCVTNIWFGKKQKKQQKKSLMKFAYRYFKMLFILWPVRSLRALGRGAGWEQPVVHTVPGTRACRGTAGSACTLGWAGRRSRETFPRSAATPAAAQSPARTDAAGPAVGSSDFPGSLCFICFGLEILRLVCKKAFYKILNGFYLIWAFNLISVKKNFPFAKHETSAHFWNQRKIPLLLIPCMPNFEEIFFQLI